MRPYINWPASTPTTIISIIIPSPAHAAVAALPSSIPHLQHYTVAES